MGLHKSQHQVTPMRRIVAALPARTFPTPSTRSRRLLVGSSRVAGPAGGSQERPS